VTVMFCTDVGVCLCGIKLSITASFTTSEWTLTVDLREMEGWRGLQDLTVKLLEKRAVSSRGMLVMVHGAVREIVRYTAGKPAIQRRGSHL
jgi:hypothetical protein